MRGCQLCKHALRRKPFASPHGGIGPDFPMLYCNNCGVYYFDTALWCGLPDGSGRAFWGQDEERITALANFVDAYTDIDKSNPDAFLLTLTDKPETDAQCETIELTVGAQRLDDLTVAVLKDTFLLTFIAMERGVKQLVRIRFSGFSQDSRELWQISRLTTWWYSIWEDVRFCPCLLDPETLALCCALTCASMTDSFISAMFRLRSDWYPHLSSMHPDWQKRGVFWDQSLNAFACILDEAEDKGLLARDKQGILSAAMSRLESLGINIINVGRKR